MVMSLTCFLVRKCYKESHLYSYKEHDVTQKTKWSLFWSFEAKTILKVLKNISLIPPTSSPSSQSGSAVMGGTVNAAWWWSVLGEGAKVSHLCCLCAASLAASSTHRLKGGVRRQMLNDSLKATAPALISSPVCAGFHSNWPEHLKEWVTLQYILAHKLLEEFIEHTYQ